MTTSRDEESIFARGNRLPRRKVTSTRDSVVFASRAIVVTSDERDTLLRGSPFPRPRVSSRRFVERRSGVAVS
jgi:hypothetical protein